MSITDIEKREAASRSFLLLLEHRASIAQLVSQAKSIAQELAGSEAFMAIASQEEMALIALIADQA